MRYFVWGMGTIESFQGLLFQDILAIDGLFAIGKMHIIELKCCVNLLFQE
jgi:hypothetical protein